MKEQELVEKYRKIYLNTKIPDDVNWDNLRIRIANHQQKEKQIFSFPISMAFLSFICILFLSTIIGGIFLANFKQPSSKDAALGSQEVTPSATPTISTNLGDLPATSQSQLKKQQTPTPSPSPSDQKQNQPQPSTNSQKNNVEKTLDSIIQNIKKIDDHVKGVSNENKNQEHGNNGQSNRSTNQSKDKKQD